MICLRPVPLRGSRCVWASLCLVLVVWQEVAVAQKSLPDTSGVQDAPSLLPTGVLRLNYFEEPRGYHGDEPGDSFGGTIQVKWQRVFSDYFSARFEARQVRPNFGRARNKVLEAYGSWRFDDSELRIGKQIIAWGRADGVNPTDNLSPRDYAVPLPFDADQRFGVTGARLDAYLSDAHTLMLFMGPFFQPSKLELPKITGVRFIEERPSARFGDPTVAIKLDRTGDDIDWSVSYLSSFNLLPASKGVAEGNGDVLVTQRYPKINVLGVDVARNYGRFGIRAEAAYFSPGSNYDQSRMHPMFYWVLGADRTFLENLNVNLQLVGRRISGYTDPEAEPDLTLRKIAIQNAITLEQQKRTSLGITSRISEKWWNDTLTAELYLHVNLQRTNYYFRPSVSYAFADNVKATLGVEFYGGEEDTPFGRQKGKNGVFSELRFSF